MKAKAAKVDDITNLIQGYGAIAANKAYCVSGKQLNELVARWKQAGMKEVVEAVKAMGFYYMGEWHPFNNLEDLLNDKLKEWGTECGIIKKC